jgi:DNA-binding IclR family transcriptional regulator
MAGNSAEPGRTVTSKLAAILTTCTSGEHTLSDLARQSGLAVSTMHRLVAELVRMQILERTGCGGYRPGTVLRSLTWETPTPTLRNRAPFIVDDLAAALHRTVRLGVLNDLDIAYIQKEPDPTPGTLFPNTARLPLQATALGKALLAYASPLLIQMVSIPRLTRFTPHTLTHGKQLHAALHRTRVNGFATTERELDLGTCAVGMPVFDPAGAPIAAIEVQVHNLSHSTLALVVPALALAARGLSRELAPAHWHCRPVPASSWSRRGRARPAPHERLVLAAHHTRANYPRT